MVFESRFKNIKDIPSAAMIGLEGEDIFIPRFCLLYTSPSPRD